MARRKITDSTEADVMFNSDGKCCVCKGRGDHIHHIDKNPGNSIYPNLALLCFEHHHEATVTSGLRKSLSAKTILKFRDEHYRGIAAGRKKVRQGLNSPIGKLTTDDLIEASLIALSIMEVSKIKEEYEDQDWNEKANVLNKLFKLSSFSSVRVSYEVLQLLRAVEGQVRGGMPVSVAMVVESLIGAFFPTSYEHHSKNENIELGKECNYIGFGIAYDAFVWLNDLSVGFWGLQILKHVYLYAKHHNASELINHVYSQFDELEGTLKRPERDDLDNALEFVRILRNDLDRRQMDCPDMPAHLLKLVAKFSP